MASLLVGGGAYWLFAWVASGVFPLEEVVVKGGDGLPQGALESVISELAPRGASLLMFNGRLLTRRLERETRVAVARLHRRLPSTLVVEIVQREPLAIVKEEHRGWVCDREGIILQQADLKADNLPIIEVETVTWGPLGPGSRLRDKTLTAALEGVSFLRAAGSQTPERVCLSQRRGMEIKLAEGPWLRLGPPVRVEQKLQACLQVLEKSPEKVRISMVDVSCPDYSYYELAAR